MTLLDHPIPTRHTAAASTSSAAAPTPITVAYGDGIGPEITRATLRILTAAGARISPQTVEVGQSVYRRGVTSGIDADAWESLRRTRVLLKGPITTPQGGGYKSLNVTIRKSLGLYANVRPCAAYAPFVATRHPGMNVVIIRENEEDTYAGIEHRQTREVTQCLKLITRPGCERIVRYAFEYAVKNGRKKVTCFTKDNIHKLTDGLFHKVFDEIGAEYPQVAKDHKIIDIGCALLADQPGKFDVIVTPNLYGDIISDVAAQITGSVGLGASANIGTDVAMFEAIHGSAPDLAGLGVANPSGLILASVMMLVHIGQPDVAERVHNAWLATIEDGVHTQDVYDDARSSVRVGTDTFADHVIERLGQEPRELTPVRYGPVPNTPVGATKASTPRQHTTVAQPEKKELVGVDVFLDWDQADRSAEVLAKRVREHADGFGLKLKMITNRGVKVWPEGFAETFCTDHWRCRFTNPSGVPIDHAAVVSLLGRLHAAGLDFVKTEHLYTFDGVPGYSMGQGE